MRIESRLGLNRVVLLLALVFTLSTTLFAEGPDKSLKPASGLITLYSRDPLSHTICFRDGQYGTVVQDAQVKNRCSDIDFDSYNSGKLTAGIEGGRLAAIVDLGTQDELQKKYGYEETVGKGQGFASIQVKNGKVYILKDRKAQTLQELIEARELFGPMASGESAAIKVGHLYIVRVTDRHDTGFESIVKLLVVSYTPGESVTIRWQTL
jgi:hypothetical protein